MAERQGRDEMKACTHSGRPSLRQNCTTALDGQTSFIDLFCFSDRIRFKWKHNPERFKPIQKIYRKFVANANPLVIHWTNSAIHLTFYSSFFLFSVSSDNIIMLDGHMNDIFIKQPGLISNLSFWEGSKTVSSLWTSLLVVKILPFKAFLSAEIVAEIAYWILTW